MPMLKLEILAAPLLLAIFAVAAHAESSKFGFGRAPTNQEIAGWNIDIGRDGKELPPGRGSVQEGRTIFAEKCASCHGEKGEGGVGDRLVGGQGTLASAKPVKTVGSLWPYAPTLFDYIRRAMPLTAPQSLSNDDVYSVSAYVLFLNGLVPESAVVDGKALTALRMPNRDGFIGDPRPDVKNADCMTGCAP